MSAARKKFLWLGIALLAHCSSWGSFWQVDPTPTVLYVSPVDNSTGNATQSVVTVTFSTGMSIASITANTADTLCSGSVQLSINEFTSCIRMPSTTLNSDGTVLTLGHVGIPNGQTAKVRITTAVTSGKGKAIVSDYTSAGFKTVNPPCGAGNCITGAMTLGFTLGNGANVAPIKSGVHAGKYLIVMGAGNTTRIYDPGTQSFAVGPNLTNSVFGGGYNMQINSGSRVGHIAVVTAGGGNIIEVYNPATNAFTVNAVSSNYAPNSSCFSLAIESGPDAGKFLMVTGNSQTTSERFDPVANTITANAVFAGNAGGGASAFHVTSGSLNGKILVVAAGGTSAVYTVNPTTFATGSGPALTGGSATTGSRNFMITSGPHAGKVIVHLGAGSSTNIFDPAAGTFASGSSLANSVATASSVQRITYGTNAGNFLVTMGGGQALTNIFNSTTLGYSAAGAPVLPFTVSAAPEFMFTVEGGLYPDSIFIAGGSSQQYALYFP